MSWRAYASRALSSFEPPNDEVTLLRASLKDKYRGSEEFASGEHGAGCEFLVMWYNGAFWRKKAAQFNELTGAFITVDDGNEYNVKEVSMDDATGPALFCAYVQVSHLVGPPVSSPALPPTS